MHWHPTSDPLPPDAEEPSKWDRWMRPLYWLAGARWETLRHCPATERERVAVLGSTVLIPTVMSFLGMIFYAKSRFADPPWLAVFSIALATVILPGLSAQHAEGSTERFSGTLDWALRLVMVVVIPAAVGLFVLAGPITAAIFGYGQFSARDVEMTRYGLMAYSWGLVGFSLVKVLAPGYFARQDTRTPVRVGLIALAVNMALNVGVVLPAHYAGFPAPFVLLATSTCISAAVNSTLLWRGLRREGVYRPLPGWGVLLWRLLFANGCMAVALWWFTGDLERWLAAAPLDRALHLVAGVLLGVVVYATALFASGLRSDDLRNRGAAV